jgi:hypothetical protein
VIKRIGLLVTAALVAAMMLVATAAPAFAAKTCPGPGCKDDTSTDLHTGSPSGKDKDTTPFDTVTETSQQNSPNAKKANKEVIVSTCVLLPNGNPKPGQPDC